MINDFLGIAIVGAALSGIVDFLKVKFGTSSNTTKAITIALSIVLGGIYVMLEGTPAWTTILGVLAAASTVYALILK